MLFEIEKYTQKYLLLQTTNWSRRLVAGIVGNPSAVRVLADKVEMCFFFRKCCFPLSMIPANIRYFSRLQNNRTGSAPQKPSVQCLPEALSMEIKQQGLQSDQLLPRNVEVKNKRSYKSKPYMFLRSVQSHIYLFCAGYLSS
jgi:hypothetical protein